MLQEIIIEAADTLRADPYFSNIPVVSEDLGDPVNLIDQSLTKVGTGVIIMTPKANVKHQNIPGPYFEDIIFLASVWENVSFNRAASGSGTGKPALQTAEIIAALLDFHSPPGVSEAMTPLSPTIALVPDTRMGKDGPRLLCYNVLYRTCGGVSYDRKTIAPITATVVDNGDGTKTVSLATATPWAYIWFTTDGSYPAPLDFEGNSRSPYSAPFTVSSPTKILARSWLPGYLASLLSTINI